MPSTRLLFLTLLNVTSYGGRYLVPAVLPLIIADFSLSNRSGGLLVAAFVFGYFLCAPLFGYLGDNYRRPWLMAAGVVIWAAALLAFGWSRSFLLLLVLRLMLGVGQSSYAAVTPGYIKDCLNDPSKLTKFYALFFSAIPVGSALAYVVSGVMVTSHSWRTIFVVWGAVTLLLSTGLLSFKEVRPARPRSSEGFLKGVLALCAIPAMWFGIVGYILNNFALNGIAAFVTSYGEGIGFEVSAISRHFGVILVITGLSGTVLGGWLAGRLARNSPNSVGLLFSFVGCCALLGVPFAWAAFCTVDHRLFLACCFFAELFIFATVAPLNSLLVLACPPQLVALTQGAAIFALNLFGALPAPVIVGIVADSYSLRLGLQVCTAALLGSGVVWLAGGALVSAKDKQIK